MLVKIQKQHTVVGYWKRLPRAAVTTPNLTEFTKFLDNTLRPTVCFLRCPMQAQQVDLMILMSSFQFCLFYDFMIKQPMQNKIKATRHRLLTQICHYIINEHNRIPHVYILRYTYTNVHINPGPGSIKGLPGSTLDFSFCCVLAWQSLSCAIQTWHVFLA